ncbi:hypothetical protein JL720_12677 [Aureococcus anophagefferens]|nr:hypothetical protein JL720_12677 [Aureococcus anophagefferens]
MDDRASSVTGAKAAEQYLAHHHAANDDDDDDLDAALVAAMLEADVRESAVPVTTGLQVMASPAELDRVGTEATFKREHAREVFVLNDALIVATRADGEKHGWWRGSGASSATDDDDDGTCPLLAKQCVPWADVLYVEDLRWDLAASHAKPCFEIGTTARSFRFLAADAADLDGWLQGRTRERNSQLQSLISRPFSTRWLRHVAAAFLGVARELDAGGAATIGWRHEKMRGTLWSACFLGAAGALPALLKAADDLDARDGDGFAPLHYAAYAGDARAVRSLVDAGADAGAAASPPPGATGDAADFRGAAPLHVAACVRIKSSTRLQCARMRPF